MSMEHNKDVSTIGWNQIKYRVLNQLEGFLHMEGIEIKEANWHQDIYEKIDAIMSFIDNNGHVIYKNIQFRFWHDYIPMAAGNYLTVRLKSWSESKNSLVPSEFYNGRNIDFFVQGVLDKNNNVSRYVIIDWKKLFPKFNRSIFPWGASNYNSWKLNNYFYYEKQLPANDGIHKNSMITIPIEKGHLINNIDKSLETVYPETVILKVGFRK